MRETALSINDVPAYVEQLTGHRPGLSTCWRWVLKGSGGAKLESFLIGGRRHVYPSAVERFMSRSSRNEATPNRTPRQRARAVKRAKRELAREGL